MAFYHTMCFVFTVLVICNVVLYPTLFGSVFKKYFGSAAGDEPKEKLPEMPPQMRSGQRSPNSMRRNEMENTAQRNMMMKNSDPASYFAQQKQEASKGRGVMGSVLPVYAVGIVIYFAYIMYRIFLKDKSRSPDSSVSLFDADHEGASLQRMQEEQLQRQLSEQLKAENYTGLKTNQAVKGGKTRKPKVIPEADTSDGNQDEMTVLKKRLADTERSMQRMMDMMNNMGVAMSQVTEQLTGGVPADFAPPRNDFNQEADDECSEEGQRSSEEASDFDDGDDGGDEDDDDGVQADRTTDEDDGGDAVEDIPLREVEESDTVRRRLVASVGGES